MSQYSETIGSFIRTGNYPLEANYIFDSEEALKLFYSDPIASTTLHEGLLKIVKTDSKLALYWVVSGDNGFEFKELINNLDIGNLELELLDLSNKLEQEILDRKNADKLILGTDDISLIPEDVNNILKIATALKELQSHIDDIYKELELSNLNLKDELKATVGTNLDDIKAYLETLDYKSITDLSNALHRFLLTVDKEDTSINTWIELLQFLTGYTEDLTLLNVLNTTVSNILGDPNPSSLFSTLRNIEEFIRTLQDSITNSINNLLTELNRTQEGVGLDQSGNYSPDLLTTYLKNATSVMNALRTLDNLVAEILNRGAIYTAKGSVDTLDDLKKIPIVKQGDVYNIVADVIINGKSYPAYTNFVYIGEEPNLAVIESNWDSLGGVVDLSNYYNKLEVNDLIEKTLTELELLINELDSKTLKGIKLEGNASNLPISEGIVTIPKATSSLDGVLQSTDKLFIDGIREGNLALPTPTIAGTWTFYNSSDTVVDSKNISPVPNTSNPTLEQGYKASFSGTYKWVHEDGKKDPTQVQSGSSWTDLPTSNVDSQTYTTPHVITNTTIKIGIQAAKTGLMVSGSNVVPASGMDTTTAQRTVTFTTRRYWGNSTLDTITEAEIKKMSNELGGRASTKSGITSDTSNYFVYAYPKSLGTLSGIVLNDATPVLTAFTRQELTITNAAGTKVDLYIYRSNNKGAFTNAKLQFT